MNLPEFPQSLLDLASAIHAAYAVVKIRGEKIAALEKQLEDVSVKVLEERQMRCDVFKALGFDDSKIRTREKILELCERLKNESITAAVRRGDFVDPSKNNEEVAKRTDEVEEQKA